MFSKHWNQFASFQFFLSFRGLWTQQTVGNNFILDVPGNYQYEASSCLVKNFRTRLYANDSIKIIGF